MRAGDVISEAEVARAHPCKIRREQNAGTATVHVAEATSALRFAAMPVAVLFKFKIQLASEIFAGVVIIMTRARARRF